MEAKARSQSIRISAQKFRLVADQVRGKNVDDALTLLRFMPKKGARILKKLIEAALSNATQNEAIDVDTLFIKKVTVDEGPTMKRFRPMPMGRAGRILKRSSHVTVVLDEA